MGKRSQKKAEQLINKLLLSKLLEEKAVDFDTRSNKRQNFFSINVYTI